MVHFDAKSEISSGTEINGSLQTLKKELVYLEAKSEGSFATKINGSF